MDTARSLAISWIDRLRIERLVWTLDQRLYDLPRRSRIAHRHEVRQNLLTAATDVGTTAALRGLGNSRELAEEYRTAQFGIAPRPAYYSAALFLLTAQLIGTSLLGEAANAFARGITAANPHASGSYAWSGIAYLQSEVTYHFTDGHGDWRGGAWTPLAWVLWLTATILVGRLWRVIPGRHRSARTE
ncbi:hypothetical protein M6D93_11740 [Jatrophihabitans telluris]|uniref:Uncharacterized protein n=1 Tax=Jatrophihabitans telluris TaxID=2038343 RepID=A0ABY4QU71_9ACTN|nr:hypothetical protein [Jatrophihabitans telluris]UQX86978.1 hypothetical protein M6D93_11740 [Jatrophihabitans telluris]